MNEVFDRGTKVCQEHRLPQHPFKRFRGARDGVALGAESVRGRNIGSERMRRAYLALISLVVARCGKVTGGLVRRVVSNWTYCALFRRPAMCTLGTCFKQLPRTSEDHKSYMLQKKTRDELTMMSCIYPLLFTHLDARQSDRLVCTDASSKFIGAAASPIPPQLHK